jgi:hypothetical protein
VSSPIRNSNMPCHIKRRLEPSMPISSRDESSPESRAARVRF